MSFALWGGHSLTKPTPTQEPLACWKAALRSATMGNHLSPYLIRASFSHPLLHLPLALRCGRGLGAPIQPQLQHSCSRIIWDPESLGIAVSMWPSALTGVGCAITLLPFLLLFQSFVCWVCTMVPSGPASCSMHFLLHRLSISLFTNPSFPQASACFSEMPLSPHVAMMLGGPRVQFSREGQMSSWSVVSPSRAPALFGPRLAASAREAAVLHCTG